jgi:hypothetical protein
MLRLELLDGLFDELWRDSAPVEVVPDEQVAGPAPREELGATVRKPCVVDCSGPHEPVDSLLPRRCRQVAASEPFGELPLGEIASRDRTRGSPERLVLLELMPQAPGALPVELDADVEPSREHDLRRQDSPGLTLERHLDSSARPRAQRANSWRRPSP